MHVELQLHHRFGNESHLASGTADVSGSANLAPHTTTSRGAKTLPALYEIGNISQPSLGITSA
jgi:hypothetical protein